MILQGLRAQKKEQTVRLGSRKRVVGEMAVKGEHLFCVAGKTLGGLDGGVSVAMGHVHRCRDVSTMQSQNQPLCSHQKNWRGKEMRHRERG